MSNQKFRWILQCRFKQFNFTIVYNLFLFCHATHWHHIIISLWIFLKLFLEFVSVSVNWNLLCFLFLFVQFFIFFINLSHIHFIRAKLFLKTLLLQLQLSLSEWQHFLTAHFSIKKCLLTFAFIPRKTSIHLVLEQRLKILFSLLFSCKYRTVSFIHSIRLFFYLNQLKLLSIVVLSKTCISKNTCWPADLINSNTLSAELFSCMVE